MTAMESDFQRTVKTLEKAGYVPQSRLNELVRDTNTASISTVLHGLTGSFGKSRQKRGLAISSAVETLSHSVFDFRGRARHFIVLDGLDKQFASGEVPWEAITSLVVTIDTLNAELWTKKSPAKVVLLMRPDMYDRLRSADTPKIRRDSGKQIDWYPSSENHSDSELFDLINRKASVAFDREIDVVGEYFPTRIQPRRGSLNIDVHRYLLERTRHTPRDLGQLLESIRRKVDSSRSNEVTVDNVIDGANDFAFDYFYSDVRSALVGLVSTDDTDKVLALLKIAPGDKFSRRWMLEAAAERSINLEDVDEVLRQLHQAGALCNIDRSGRVNFIYVQPTAELDVHGFMTLQRTFARGLNRAPLWMKETPSF